MKKLSVIQKTTGRVLYSLMAQGPAADCQQAPDGCYALPVELDPETQWIENGEVMTRPPPPEGPAAWDWCDKSWKTTAPTLDDLAAAARAKRADLLALTDWTQLPDVPITTREAWAAYRQALRDITDQPGYPTAIEWPIQPT